MNIKEQRKANLRLGWALAGVAALLLVGFIARMVVFGG
jgi:CHASE3 domain sensor protein